MNERAKVLIVLLGAIGDVVRGLAVAQQIKGVLPNSHVSWVVEPKSEGVVRLAKCVDEVIVFNRQRPLLGALQLIRDLRFKKFDITLDMQRHFKSGCITWFSGASRRIGFHRKNAKELNWLFQTETIKERDDSLNKFFHYQEFLTQLDIPQVNSPVIELNCEVSTPRISFEGNYVVVVMGSSWDTKDWIKESYLECVSNLLGKNYGVVLVGDRKQAELAEQIVSQFRGSKIQSFAGKTDLKELIGLLKGARVAVGPDSGPGHIAAMLGKNYVSVFGPTSPKRVAPVGNEHLVVTANVGCSPCYLRECPGLDKICMRLIPVNEVCNKVQIAFQQSFE